MGFNSGFKGLILFQRKPQLELWYSKTMVNILCRLSEMSFAVPVFFVWTFLVAVKTPSSRFPISFFRWGNGPQSHSYQPWYQEQSC